MTREVVGAAIVAAGRVLAARRVYPPAAVGRWELPGGKVADGETAAAAVVREIREELSCEVEVLRPMAGRSTIKPDHELRVLLARVVAGQPTPHEHDALRWLGPEDLDDVGWLESDRPFLPELKTILLRGSRLAGGNVGGAVRVGGSVRRTTGPWTPAVHVLLEWLDRSGLAEVPRPLGVDELGREVLTYLPGRVVDIDTETPSEALLADAMRWLGRFHDAVAGFAHPGPWRTADAAPDVATDAVPAGVPDTAPPELPDALGGGRIICHHDFAPYNVAVSSSARGERVVGVFDWDMAGPGSRLDDLAFAAWSWVPLARPLPDGVVARRVALMADAYGRGVEAERILHAVGPRIERSIRVIGGGQAAGDPGMLNLAEVGEPARTAARLEQMLVHVPAIEEELHRCRSE